jgi:glutamate formiminotransferase/formiminotetrahydrofolate cyclodeaminase
VIGARPPLIAYNVYLNTAEVDIAKKIAKALRHSSGGLRFVKGLGLLVDGKAQISMNLTNYPQTPIAHVMDMIRAQAQRYGVQVRYSELVGLIPQNALIDAAQYYLQLDAFNPDQILESRLQGMGRGSSFLDELAAGTPTPGGGSAAAHAGGMAAALVAMVARLTLGKKKYAEVQDRMAEIALIADQKRAFFEKAVQEDAAAFSALMTANKLPKEAPERPAAIQQATIHAAAVPLHVAQTAAEILSLAAEVAENGNSNAISDAASGAALARAAYTAASLNVRINASGLTDSDQPALWQKILADLESQMVAAEKRIQAALQTRVGL